MSRNKEADTPLYLNALGIVNALGKSKPEVLANLIRGYQGGIVEANDLSISGPVRVGRVNDRLPDIPEKYECFNSRNNRLLLAAYRQINEECREFIDRYGRERVAVIIGSSTSGILEGEQAVRYETENKELFPGYHYRQQEIGSPSEFLSTYLEIGGLAYTISTACSSSAKVFSSAANLIRAGLCDAVLVGGVDSLCRLTINGFASLESLSSGICNPFSRNRDGITIGEGAALFILSRHRSRVRLLGVGESSDAYHVSAPCPDGIGAKTAIRAALSQAAAYPGEIDYINLHGTATDKNDTVEAAVVNEVFGEKVACSSTKAMTGHTLGAAGATEVGFCWLLLSDLNKDNALPPNVWDGQADEGLAKLGLVEPGDYYSRNKARNICVSNSFAFGGSNACVIIGADNL